MRAVIQRVKKASVTVGTEIIAGIQKGIVVLLGVDCNDTKAQAEILAKKITELRIFDDAKGKMNLSLEQVNGQILAVPQFTLSADLSHGRRPSFDTAAAPDYAKKIFDHFVNALKLKGTEVKEGRFGLTMLVDIANDGPVTFIL